jgi:hypothetical protein
VIAETGALLAEVRQLRSELAEVREELAALDRGIVATGETAGLALARANALAAVMAAPYEAAGEQLPAGVTRLPARRARLTVHQGGAL